MADASETIAKAYKSIGSELFESQALQVALFSKLNLGINIYIDSTVRLRFTHKGMGGFVGPHVDKYEGLPRNCINFWTTYTNLDKGETINLLPEEWTPATSNSGHLKPGTRHDLLLRLQYDNHIRNAGLSTRLKKGESLVFNSSVIPHCSPIGLSSYRLTSDSWLYVESCALDSLFCEKHSYYNAKQLSNFATDKEPRLSVADILSGEKSAHAISLQYSVDQLIDEKVDPVFIVNNICRESFVDERLLIKILRLNPFCIQSRLVAVKSRKLSRQTLKLVVEDIIQLPAENQRKVLALLIVHVPFSILVDLHCRIFDYGALLPLLFILLSLRLWLITSTSPKGGGTLLTVPKIYAILYSFFYAFKKK